jgi:hypothetical protein
MASRVRECCGCGPCCLGVRAACLGRRAGKVDADGPLGPMRRGLAVGAGFGMSRDARGMGKERPGERVRGPERRGTGTGTRRRPARDRVDVPRFEHVFLKNFE